MKETVSQCETNLDNSRSIELLTDTHEPRTIQRVSSLSFIKNTPVLSSCPGFIDMNTLPNLPNFSNLSYYLDDLNANKQDHSFQKFVLFSVDDTNISSNNVRNWGNSLLSPLTLKVGSVSYQFPTFDYDPREKELFPFCYPHGLEIRVIPRYLSESAKQLGWMGSKADKYQLHEVRFMMNICPQLLTF